jgi:hypothetical protein
MTFSEVELKYIENVVGKMCKRRSPGHLRHQLRTVYVVEGHDVTVYQERPNWNNPREWTTSSAAKFKYNRKQNVWKLYWMGQNQKWHSYGPLPESIRIDKLVVEVDNDPHGAFFGSMTERIQSSDLLPHSNNSPSGVDRTFSNPSKCYRGLDFLTHESLLDISL